MPFALMDDIWFCNPKVTQLSKDAKLLYLAGLCFCSRNLTDGVLTSRSVKIIQVEVDAKPRHVLELAALGFWDRMIDGYLVHDYGDVNRPAEEIKQRRKEISEKRRDAGKKGAAARWGATKSDGKSHGKEPSRLPMPLASPDPDPDRPYRPVEVLSPGKAENPAVVGAAERLFAAIRPEHRDRGTRAIVLAFVQELEPADFESVTGELERCRDDIRCEGKWVNGALRKRAVKRAATRRQVA